MVLQESERQLPMSSTKLSTALVDEAINHSKPQNKADQGFRQFARGGGGKLYLDDCAN